MDLKEHGAAMAALEAALRQQFRTKESEVPIRGATLKLLHPANADDLISEADYVKDERLPYWADIWPSSVAFAGEAHRLLPRPGRLLELGCGTGVISSAAARLGHDVLATDYYLDALNFARLNAWRNAKRDIAVRHVDWRSFPADIGTFETVVACDVLYEVEYATLVAEAIRSSLAPGGIAIIADPGRVAAETFVKNVPAMGMTVEVVEKLPWSEGEAKQTINILELRHAP